MQTIQRREIALAVLLAGTAGYLDAIGFLTLSGRFVSFMSGNTTHMAADVADLDWNAIGFVATILITFFAGAVLGAVLSHVWDGRTTVLACTSLLVGVTALIGTVTDARLPIMLGLPLAMGVVNATFLRSGSNSIPLTYMTGALVNAGHSLVEAFRGGFRVLWLRHLAMWSALLIGAITGAAAHHWLGMPGGLWPPVVFLVTLTVIVAVERRRRGIFGGGAHPATEREIKVL